MQKQIIRKILTGLLSLAVAVALWLYVVTVVGPEYTDTFRDIPVVFQGASALEERGLMLLTDETPTVTLELSGNRSDLKKLSTSNISVIIDLSKVYDPGKTAYRYDVGYPGNVAKDAITVQNQKPTGITLEVVRKAYKDVPIELDYTGTLPESYIKEKPVLEMDTVRISGPEEVVEKIETARITVTLSEETTTTVTGEYTFTLCDGNKEPVDARYISVSGEAAQAVTVTVPIKRVKEIPLTVKLVEGGGATAANSTVEIDPKTIQVSGSEAALENLTELSLGTVDLTAILEDTQLTFDIVLPEGITNETGLTQATVSISFPKLTTKQFRVTHFQTINVPAGMKATVSTKELVVTLRGSKSVIEALIADDITVTADFSGAEAGTQYVDVTITVNGGRSEVGAIGTYTVLARVEKA